MDRAIEQRRPRPVGAERVRDQQPPAARGHPPAQIQAVKLQRRVLGHAQVQPAELVERSERERRRLPAAERVIGAQLVVAVAERVVDGQQREERARVRIARRRRDGAAAAVPGPGDDPARVVEGDVGRRVHPIGGRRHGARGHDPGDEAAVAGRIAARIEVDAADQVGVDRRRAEPDVEQRGDAHAVQEEPGVARVGAAHDVHRRGPDDLLHAGQRPDHAQRIARRAGDGSRLLAADVHLRDLGARRSDGRFVELARLRRGQVK